MKKLLFNPFERFAGATSVVIGILILAATAVIAFFGQIRLDGVLDLHVGQELSLLTAFLEALINWLSMTLLIYLAGLVLSRSSIRFVDVLGTQAMARFPYFIACIFTIMLFNGELLRRLEYAALNKGEPAAIGGWDMTSLILMGLVMIATLIWMVLLMYRAYSVSCNLKGNKAIISFIVCVLLAEALSKVLIIYLLS